MFPRKSNNYKFSYINVPRGLSVKNLWGTRKITTEDQSANKKQQKPKAKAKAKAAPLKKHQQEPSQPQTPPRTEPQWQQQEQWGHYQDSFEQPSMPNQAQELMKQRVKVEEHMFEYQPPQPAHGLFEKLKKRIPKYKSILDNMGSNNFYSCLEKLYDDSGLVLLPNGDYCIQEWHEEKQKLLFKKRWHCTNPFETSELCCDCALWTNENACKHTLFCVFDQLSTQLHQHPLAVKPSDKEIINENVVYLGQAQRRMFLKYIFCSCKDIL